MALARAQNFGLAAARVGLEISQLDPYIQRGIFDPTLQIDLNHNQSSRSAFSETSETSASTRSERSNLSIQAIRPTRTGGNWILEYTADRTDISSALGSDSSGESWGSTTLLRYSHPLLEGAGAARTRSPITQAEINTEIAAANLEREQLTLEQRVTAQYLAVLRAQRQLETAALSLNVAESLFEQVEAQVEAGSLARFELTNAEGGLALRQESVLLAEQAEADALDALRQLLGLPRDWPLTLADSLNTDPVLGLTHADSYAVALTARPEVTVIDLREELNTVRLADARDRLQDTLNLNASAGLEGAGDEYGDSLSNMDDFSWSIGLQYIIPLGTDHRAKGQASQAELAEDQLALDRRELTTQIESDVAQALRALTVAAQRLTITDTGVRVAEERLSNERARLDLGLSTAQQVLDVEEDVAIARRQRIDAEIAFAQSKAAFLAVLGLSQLEPLPASLDVPDLLPAPPVNSEEATE